MTKLYIDYEWGVETPIYKGEGVYLSKKELEELNLDIALNKMIQLWSFAIQNEMNWHNPNDQAAYLPKYYYDFVIELEKDIINRLKDFNIELVKNA